MFCFLGSIPSRPLIVLMRGPFCATLKTQSNSFILLYNESVFMYRYKLLAYFVPRYAPSIIYGMGDSLFEFTCSQEGVTPPLLEIFPMKIR